MTDGRRWVARYQFLDELWRGRDRIVFDPELERELHGGGPDDDRARALLDALVPATDPDARVWVVLEQDRRAASLLRARAATEFLGVDEASAVAGEGRWKVAVVHVGALAGDRALNPSLAAFLDVLGEQAQDDDERTVVLVADSRDDEDATYDALADLVDEVFSDGRIYGATRPAIVGFYDFGRVLEAEEADLEQADEDASGFEVDNTLGPESPRFDRMIAVVGARVPAEGAALIEVPADAGPAAGSRREGGDSSALRVQLAEAQRRADEQAIERQALLEQVERGEDRIAALEEALAAEGGGARTSAAPADGPRLDEALASQQSLRWELERMRGELEILQSRPVETLEADVAAAQARLVEAEAELETRGRRIAELEAALVRRSEAGPARDPEDDEDEDEDDDEGLVLVFEPDEPDPARVRADRSARARVSRLLRKLERGAQVSALELHRELSKLVSRSLD